MKKWSVVSGQWSVECAIVGALAGALYVLTLAKGVCLPDSVIIMEAMQKPVVSGFACNHTLNNLVGWVVCRLLPFGGLAWRCHFVSALYGAAIAALFYALLRRHGGTRALAAVCTATLATSHGVWWHSTVVENYGLSAVFFLACLHLVTRQGSTGLPTCDQKICCAQVRRPVLPYFLLGLIAGLSLLNHLQNGMLCVAALAAVVSGQWSVARKKFTVYSLQFTVLGLAVGCLPYCAMVAWETWRGMYGDSWVGWFIGGGGFESVMFTYSDPRAILSALGSLFWWQFYNPAFLSMVIIGGIASIFGRTHVGKPAQRFCWIVILGNTLFFAGYPTWDQYSFFLVPFIGFAVIGSLYLIQQPLKGRRAILRLMALLIVTTSMLYACSPQYYPGYETRYRLKAMLKDPVRKDGGTIDFFLRSALAALPPNAVWVDDGSSYFQAKWLQEREGVRPDVRLEHIATPLMRGVGTEAKALAGRKQWREPDVPWFVVADNHATRPFTDILARTGWQMQPYPVGDGLSIFQLYRPDPSPPPPYP
ncbi:MAG: hypothetical protein FWF84_01125 [Kiritimatiellaeota bacterium]|nr:hypothetical protein [Kiritimatiellota bacterium]